MNFLDLYKKIQSLDEGLSQGDMSVQATSAAPSSPIMTSEEETCTECGDMHSMGQHTTSSQPDNVSMNVSMTGSGKGGIRDLIDVLKNIEHSQDHGDNVLVGKASGIEVPMMGDEYANEPAPETSEIDAVIPTGNDLHSKGLEAEKQAGGGNPWRQMDVSESLVRRLSNHYAEVKDRVSEGYGRYRSPGSGMGWSQDAERRAFKRDELRHELGHEDEAAWREMNKPQLKGYYFYNIPPDTNPSELKMWGMKQLKSGKWALPIYDKSGSSTTWRKSELDKKYGPGKWWAPKK